MIPRTTTERFDLLFQRKVSANKNFKQTWWRKIASDKDFLGILAAQDFPATMAGLLLDYVQNESADSTDKRFKFLNLFTELIPGFCDRSPEDLVSPPENFNDDLVNFFSALKHILVGETSSANAPTPVFFQTLFTEVLQAKPFDGESCAQQQRKRAPLTAENLSAHTASSQGSQQGSSGGGRSEAESTSTSGETSSTHGTEASDHGT